MFVGKTFVQRAIDSQAANTAVKDSNGKGGNFGLRISDCGFQYLAVFDVSDSDFKSAFQNPKSEIQGMVEAPRIELGSKSCRRKTLHAYSLLFPGSQAASFLLYSESVKRQDLSAS